MNYCPKEHICIHMHQYIAKGTTQTRSWWHYGNHVVHLNDHSIHLSYHYSWVNWKKMNEELNLSITQSGSSMSGFKTIWPFSCATFKNGHPGIVRCPIGKVSEHMHGYVTAMWSTIWWPASWRMWRPGWKTMWYVTCEVEDDVRACEVQDDVVCDMRSGGWREGLWGAGRCGMWHAKWRMTWGPVRWKTMWYVTCEVEDDDVVCVLWGVEDDVVCDMPSGGWREGLWVWRTMWYVTCEVEDDVRACEVEDDVVCDMRSGGWREGLWGAGRCGMRHAKWRMTWGLVRCRAM